MIKEVEYFAACHGTVFWYSYLCANLYKVRLCLVYQGEIAFAFHLTLIPARSSSLLILS